MTGHAGTAALQGAVAGLVGTLAMTPLMRPALTRGLPRPMHLDEFPPKRVVQASEEGLVGEEALSDEQETALTAPAHLGYGCTMGALYGLLRSRRSGLSAPAAGAAFGVAVWAAGYAGWLPAVLDVREATAKGPPAKLPIPLAAHIVYGVATALTYEAMD